MEVIVALMVLFALVCILGAAGGNRDYYDTHPACWSNIVVTPRRIFSCQVCGKVDFESYENPHPSCPDGHGRMKYEKRPNEENYD